MSRTPQSRKWSELRISAVLILLAAAAITLATQGLTAPNVTPPSQQGPLRSIVNHQNFNGHSSFADDTARFFFDDPEPLASFTVNHDGDSVDLNVGDGFCADVSGHCTLRAAIQEANSTGAADAITFDLTVLPAVIQLDSLLSPAELQITRTLTITGPGARLLTVRGNANTLLGIFNITSGVSSTPAKISGMTVANSGGRGINNDGRLELNDIAVSGNTYGIYNTDRLIVTRATVNNNSKGGIYLDAASTATNISNSTFSDNVSTDSGAGIYSRSADVTLNNVTVSHNAAATSGGGIYFENAASGINVRNSLIANNTAPLGPDIHSQNAGTGSKFISRGNNLIGKNVGDIGFVDGVNADKVGTLAAPVDPLLGPLQNNGGPTDTRATASGSPARNAGNACVTNQTCPQNLPALVLVDDQRGNGFPRLFETGVDIGAFEAFYPTPGITSFAPPDWGTGQGAFELTVNGTNFVRNSIVRWNGVNRATTFVSNTQLKLQVLAGDVTAAGQVPITVVNPLPGGGPSAAVNFTIANCVFSINPTSTIILSTGGSGTVAVTSPGGCPWTAVSNASWITVTGGNSGRGSGTVSYTVLPNSGPPRQGTVTIGGETFTVSQGDGCSFTINPPSRPAPAGGESNSFALTASNSQCAWTAVSDQLWLTVVNTSGTGPATINYTVTANIGPARTGHINVGGQQFTVNQAYGCTFTFTPLSASPPKEGGSFSVQVNTAAGCTWTAVSNQPWVTITSGTPGNGPGTVGYTITANTGPVRTATITVNGQVFNITQADGCSFTIAPLNKDFGSAGGTQVVSVTASHGGCTWSASVTAGNTFISITGASSGTGNGSITYSVTSNNGPARNGTVRVAGIDHVVTQQNGCTLTLSPTSTSIDAVGGNRSFSVTTSNQGCQWSATTTATWITINPPTSGTGNGTVNFTVQPNNTPQRIGKIIVNGVEHTVTQANGCVYVLTPQVLTVGPIAGTGSFGVSAGQGCTFTAVSEATWITVTGGTPGTTSGTVTFSYLANPGLQRLGTILVNNVRFTLTQQNGCSFTINPTSGQVPAAGGSGTVGVTASDGQCPWTAVVNPGDPWITITSGASGTGNGVVQYSAGANINPQRVGTIVIAAKNFTVTQLDGCFYSIAPASTYINDDGGTRTFTMTTNGTQCGWSAVPETTAPWITVTAGANRTGTGVVTVNVAPSGGVERIGKVNAGGKQFTVNQVSVKVANTNDDGPGSLRRAVSNAGLAPGADVVTFQPGLSGPITLSTGEIAINSSNPVEIRGPGANSLTISGGSASRIFSIDGSAVTISGLTLRDGNGAGAGSSDSNKRGGAVSVLGGTLVLDGVMLSWNTVSVAAVPGNSAFGGALSIEQGTGHTIRNSTFFYNNARVGGAIAVSNAPLTISNSTIFGNTAQIEAGGIYNAGNVSIRNTTITRNTAATPGHNGAGIANWSGQLSFGNTIISGNNNGAEITFNSGVVFSAGNNLVGDQPGDSTNTSTPISYQPSDILDVPPKVGPLGDYGGRIETVALLPDSPARDSGSNASAPAADQRGSTRIISGTIDIGSFEMNIDISPAVTVLPNGTLGVFYSFGMTAARIENPPPSEIFRFYAVGGTMPTGISVIAETGVILGEPLESGQFEFIVQAKDANGMAGIRAYRLLITCSLSISPSSQIFSAAGQSGNSIQVTAPAGCSWSVANNSAPWVTVTSPTSHSGNGSVTYNVGANPGAERSGSLVVGGQTFAITQLAAACTYSINPNSSASPAAGGSGSVGVTANPGCAWSAQTNDPSWLTITNNTSGNGNGNVSYTVAANTGGARIGTLTIAGSTFTLNQAAAPTRSAAFDFDGDRKADVGIFRPAAGEWWYLRSSDGGNRAFGFGTSTDKIVPVDFTGDGKTDLGFWRPSTGFWYVMRSEDNTFYGFPFGAEGDIPVPGDYDADGKADAAVFRAGSWYILQSSNNATRVDALGTTGDRPVTADYDGDGKSDIAIYRPTGSSGAGEWWINMSTAGLRAVAFGTATDKAVPGDYTGDGKADIAIWRPSTGFWYVIRSEDFSFYGFPFGADGDVPAPGDYDGDGRFDAAVFRSGTWYIERSTAGQQVVGFGAAGDTPVANAFVR